MPGARGPWSGHDGYPVTRSVFIFFPTSVFKHPTIKDVALAALGNYPSGPPARRFLPPDPAL